MSFKTTGNVISILPEQTGTSAKGEWHKQSFIILEDGDQYQKNICFDLFNDKSNFGSRIKVNSVVDVHFSIESREYNGKWFSNINAFKVDAIGNKPNELPESQPFDSRTPIDKNDDSDNLPF